MNVQDLTVITPGFSVQDLSHRNIMTLPIGKVCPVLFEYVNPGEVSELDFSWFCRTFPMLAPLMDTMEISFDALWIPARVLSHSGGMSVDYDFESFFNPRNLSSGTSLPKETLLSLVQGFVKRHGRLTGTLYDYLGYPTFPKFFEEVRKVLNSMVDSDGNSNSFSTFSPDSSTLHVQSWNGFDINGTAFSQHQFLGSSDGYKSFTEYVILRYCSILSGYTNVVDVFADSLNAANNLGIDLLTYLCNKLGTTSEKLWDDWFGEVCAQIFDDIDSSYNTSWKPIISGSISQGLNLQQEVSIVPFLVYYKVVCDWYINPLLRDGDTDYMTVVNAILNGDSVTDHIETMDLCTRLYEFDRFVSATPGGDQPNVMLPATHGVKDIRNANRVQVLMERVLKTGKRYVDQILTTFGVKPSDARVDRSEVLWRRSSYLDMQTVTQTNQSSLSAALSQPLGSFAGNSTTFQAFNGGTFEFDEHGFLVVMASIRPKPSYFQGLNKFLTKLTADKFLVPDFAQIGDDRVEDSEVYFDWEANLTSYFGYQQRYYEYMSALNEVHGHMIDELRYFHLGRYFDAQPGLNESFTTVNADQNDLNRIWSTYDSQPFMMFIDFRHKMLRPLPDSTTYSL